MDTRTDHCPTCADSREFVQPPCVDGHTADGVECPEWACGSCGTALLSGPFPSVTYQREERRAA